MEVNAKRYRLRKATYAPILAFAMIMMLGRLLIYARILSVQSFAQLNAILIVSGVIGMMSSLGFFLDLQRKLPGHLALGRRRSAGMMIWQSLIGTFAIGIVGVLTSGLGVSLGSMSSSAIFFGVMHGVAQQVFLIATTESRSDNDTLRYSLQSLTRAILIFVVAVPISLEFRSALSVIILECLITAGLAVIISRKTSIRLSISSSKSFVLALRSLRRANWKSILALLLLSLAMTAASSVDRWVSSLELTPVAFAEYSFAAITLTAASAIQQLANASIYPMIARRYYISGIKAAYRLSLLTSFAMLIGFLSAIVPAVYAADFMVLSFFPNYAKSLPLLPILAVASAFRISDFWSSFLVICGRERTSLIINVTVVIAALTIWYSTRFGMQHPGAGIAALAAFIAALNYIASFFCSRSYIRTNDA